MSDERRTPLWPWIVVLLVGLPVLYIASFGPACWWLSKCKIPDPHLDYDEPLDIPHDLAPHAPHVYWPMGWLAAFGPRPISRLLFWYATAGGQQLVALPCDRDGNLSVSPP